MNPADEIERTRHLARALGLPFVDLSDYTISPGILRKLPARTMMANRCLPMVFNPRRVVLLLDDPARLACLTARPWLLGLPTDRPVEFALTTPSALEEALTRRQKLPR